MTNTQTPFGNWSLHTSSHLTAYHSDETESTGIYLGTVTGPDWQPRCIRYRVLDGDPIEEANWYIDLENEDESALPDDPDNQWYETRGDVVAALSQWIKDNKEQFDALLLKAGAKVEAY